MSENQQENKTVTSNDLSVNINERYNRLSSNQRSIFRKLTISTDHQAAIRSLIKSEQILENIGDWNDTTKLTKLMRDLSNIVYLTGQLFYEVNLGFKNDLSEAVYNLCTTIKGVIDGYSAETKRETFVTSLNNCFTLDVGTAIKNSYTYGLFMTLYKRVFNMIKVLHRTGKTIGGGGGTRKPLNQFSKGEIVDTTHARTITKKDSPFWIDNHLNYTLPICCIDNLCVFINDTSFTETSKTLSTYYTQMSQIAAKLGGSVGAYLSFIKFYYKPAGQESFDSSIKLKITPVPEDGGKFKLRAIKTSSTLNLDNECYRAKKSIMSETRVYDVYFLEGSTLKSSVDFLKD